MKKRFFPLFLALLLLLTSCGQNNVENSPSADDAGNSQNNTLPGNPETLDFPEPPAMPEAPILSEKELAVEGLLENMTLAEKVGQMFFVRCPAENAVEDISAYHLGGYLLFGRDFKDSGDNWLTREQFTETIAAYQEAASIPLLIGADEEGGTVARATRNPNLFPAKRQPPQRIYANGGEDAVVEDTLTVSSGLLDLGINVNFAPVADVSTSADDFIYDRSFGQDATATSYYVASVVDAMANSGIGSVLKHFPGYGNNVDTHTGIAIDQRPLLQFINEDFLPFEAGIAEGGGTTSVLVSHNIVTCMDADLPASLSPEVHRILREDLGFEGVILTDDLAMDAVEAYAADGSVTVLAVLSGNDMIVTTDYHTQIPLVISAVENGEIDEAIIDAAVRRVLSWKYDLGLLG